MAEKAIITRVHTSPLALDAAEWNALLAQQGHVTPFMRHEYLAALHTSDSAVPATGWHARYLTLEQEGRLVAACPLYLKEHSYGEYVFDWAWARAYQEHGLHYYPKALIAVPFTPVPGTRLLARDEFARTALLRAVVAWCKEQSLSSLHLLFGSDEDMAASRNVGLMQRTTVQFHWNNLAPDGGKFRDFEHFLGALTQDKRKKIRQEQRRVRDAGVRFRWVRGTDIAAADWEFFYRCYERTYLEHGNPPYLSRTFFERMAQDMPDAWLLFIAERGGQAIATSLIAINADPSSAGGQNVLNFPSPTAYGRYWGALERVDSLHFDACYYQPLAWCIAHGLGAFEGGAQGEHKMARALMPVATHSAHWLAHPAFADAVERFLEREDAGMAAYVEELRAHTPFRTATRPAPNP
ncbi:MAG: N-acetyltransferase [Simplicispira suum]|uniref:GNAT family N-acetyltransferase n=1 Tax=Simplicispira suum TaxID=2109915 RepID=UPI001C6ADE47|nr:GNAT family N-acetyltransferase [Simplicispira suum]MBW7834705.1 N-acetyltransferase [Simplicispira suum]